MNLKIIKTSDGSHSIHNDKINETYHSIHGSIAESNHVYINSGFKYILDRGKEKDISVLEIGFGSGLNFLLLKKYIEKKRLSIYYHTIEPFPLPEDIYKKLNYVKLLGDDLRDVYHTIHNLDEKEIKIGNDITFRKSIKTLEEVSLENNYYDTIFFDAFAPSKQPEIWSFQNLSKVYNSMKKDAVLVTYCSSSKFKKTLNDVGYKVDVLRGPVGKKEMVRASKR